VRSDLSIHKSAARNSHGSVLGCALVHRQIAPSLETDAAHLAAERLLVLVHALVLVKVAKLSE
jgi:hypothetical protein